MFPKKPKTSKNELLMTKKQVALLRQKLTTQEIEKQIAQNAFTVRDIKVLTLNLGEIDADTLRSTTDIFREHGQYQWYDRRERHCE